VADERRTKRPGTGRGRARGRSGPGARSGTARPARQQQVDRKQVQRERAQGATVQADERQRSRLTGRAAILVLVLAVLAVSFASSLRAYLQQRDRINELETTIAERKAAIEDLEDEKERWSDEAYVAQRARELGYVEVGDVPFIVLDDDGRPLGAAGQLSDPDGVGSDEERTWIDDVWTSAKVAGNPPTNAPPPPSDHLTDRSGGE
jgi:cell division protein FtsB